MFKTHPPLIRSALIIAGASLMAPVFAETLRIEFIGAITQPSCPTTHFGGEQASTSCRNFDGRGEQIWSTALRPGEIIQTDRAEQRVTEIQEEGKTIGLLLTTEYL
ncbi:hypothetical protein [Bordetella avium]|uniref:hypothetical protein n=1 Tax=Bordetella avium TaxID=521 RepID=UPI000E695533|nr:hypothetical protein [Bordetella avium]AZY51889.1 hypothetical protein C0J07_04785 [Bordetella avium]RIQ73278.1 hypothetical protein D0839_02805 [Bordetella avium]